MMPREQIIRWLLEQPPGTGISIDEGGLSLSAPDGSYLEVGGDPTTEPDCVKDAEEPFETSEAREDYARWEGTEAFKDYLRVLVEEVRRQTDEHMLETGLKFEDCQRVGVHQAAQKLQMCINGISPEDMKLDESVRRKQEQRLLTFDQRQACEEGWGLFNGGEIQRLDEQAVFKSDEAALDHVETLASAGSLYHRVARAWRRMFMEKLAPPRIHEIKRQMQRGSSNVDEAFAALLEFDTNDPAVRTRLEIMRNS